MSNLVFLDVQLTNLINRVLPHNDVFNVFFSFLSFRGSSVIIWFALFLLLVVFEEKRDKKFILYFVISLFLTSLLVNIVFKNTFKRPRPVSLPTMIERCGGGYSFPSGHASAAFAASVILAAFDRKRKYAYYLLATVISLSRIYLGCHFFGDILIGGIIGTGISWLTLRLKL